jgi:sugar lactone lactonase YvrE
MKNMTAIMLAVCVGLASLHAQTVTTITTNASKIDDDIIFDAAGNLFGSNYIGSKVYKRTPDGVESVFASGFGSPNGLAFNDDGTLIMADNTGNKLYKIFPDGSKEVFVAPLQGPSGVIRQKNSDTLIVTSYSATNQIWKVAPDGSVSTFLTHPEFNGPVGLCYDDSMNLYIANFSDRKIFKMTPGGQVTFFTQPPLGQFIGFLAYAKGSLYATAMEAHKIYKIDLEGNYAVWMGSTVGTLDGDAAVARFNRPNGIRPSSTGDTLYVSDFGSKRVRMITNLGGTSAIGELVPGWKVAVSPNPLANTAQITVELPDATDLSIGLYDDQGRLVQSVLENERLAGGAHQYALARRGLPKGIYFLYFQSSTGRFLAKKVVIQE